MSAQATAQACCVCGSTAGQFSVLSLARKLQFPHEAAWVSFDDDHVITPMRHRKYTVCPGRCERTVEHAAGWHENRRPEDCPVCQDASALYEIRQLSEAARGLICHRLRNPLATAMGHLELINIQYFSPREAARVQTIREACERTSREVTDLFGNKP